MGHLVAVQDYRYQPVVITHNDEEYLFIVNSNGSIQHSNVAYKEDGDRKITFVTADTWYKYAVTAETRDLIEKRIDVDFLNPEDVMAVITPTDSNIASPSNNQ